MSYSVKSLQQSVQDYKPNITQQQKQISTYINEKHGWAITFCPAAKVKSTLESELKRVQEIIDGDN